MFQHLFVFDLDGTLATINRPIPDELIRVLRTLSQKHKVAIASGKPFCYLAGVVRQLGLRECEIIAENGALVYFGASFPPTRRISVLSDNAYFDYIAAIRGEVIKRFSTSVWLQPSEASLTVFPLSDAVFPELIAFAHSYNNSLAQTYVHADSVDFAPTNIDKGVGLRALLKELPEQKNRFIYAFGDGENDLPLLRSATHGFVIGNKLPLEKDWKCISDVFSLANTLSDLINESSRHGV